MMSPNSQKPAPEIDLRTQLGRLTLANPVMVASGTFGYGWELSQFLDLRRLGALLPKTVTRQPRRGNPPPRIVETPAGILNSIGLDNDGIEAFLNDHLPVLTNLGCPIIASIAGKSVDEFAQLAEILDQAPALAGIELNISCPNVAGGIDFATDPHLCEAVVAKTRASTRHPILAKLTPNVTNIVSLATAAKNGGADAVVIANTLLGMSVDWRRKIPRLGGIMGGLSGPAVKPVALRAVFQVAQAVDIPIVAAGGITTLDDCMEFLVTGARAIQVGTAHFFRPQAAIEILDQLPAALAELGARSLLEVVGTLRVPRESSQPTPCYR
jgi:dihydroorotate dehydrogenase (NAD+) catalytic subunit